MRRENIQAIIVTSEQEFRNNVVQILNTVAFPAEKITVKSIPEMVNILKSNRSARNVIIDTRSPDVRKDLADKKAVISDLVKTLQACFLLLANKTELSAVQALPITPSLEIVIDVLPANKNQFIKAFHNSRSPTIKKQQAAAAPAAKEASSNPDTARAALDPADPLIETSLHLRETILQLNELSSDLSNLGALARIGQRFNGVFGTFSFFGERDGFSELRILATVIDDICRSYEKGDGKNPTSMTKPHFDLLLSAAKCSFSILKDLRETKTLDPTYRELTNEMRKTANNDPTIDKRQSQKQSDIDAFLAEQFK